MSLISNESTIKRVYPKSSISYNQLDRKQDHILNTHNNIDPVTGEIFSMIEVYDGHGEDMCIRYIRSLNTTEIITNCPFAPEMALEQAIKKKIPFMPYGSGATFSCVKIFDTHIDCRSTGDSEIRVFINNKCVYKSPNHIWANLDEQARIGHITQTIPCSKPLLLSPTKITMVDSVYVKWNNCPEHLQLVPTQSLGHRNITGMDPAVKRIDFGLDDAIRIIIGSDGFWDMIMPTEDDGILLTAITSEELSNLAEARWKQEWEFVEDVQFPEKIEKTSFDRYDDISVGLYTGAVAITTRQP